jgi:hypothetical protein
MKQRCLKKKRKKKNLRMTNLMMNKKKCKTGLKKFLIIRKTQKFLKRFRKIIPA